MKKNRIAVIILAGAALMLSSCVKEQFRQDDVTFGEGEVAFRIGSVSTKGAVEARSEIVDIATVKVSEEHSLFLQDEITSLDDIRPAAAGTKGTPAFTENVAALYGKFRTVALTQNGANVFQKGDGTDHGVNFDKPADENGFWHFNYKENWRDKSNTYFFMRMPVEQTNVTLDPTTPFDVNTGAIKFSYTSPKSEDGKADGTAQQDILFTSHQWGDEPKNGETITFYHALTGVKFANHFDYSVHEGAFGNAETIIKKITISGLHNTGSCVVTPGEGKNSATAVKWTNQAGSATFTQSIEYDFANYGAEGSKLKDTPLSAEGNKASKNNLNDNHGSLTFWFIPQEIPENATLTVVFDVSLKTIKDGVVTDKELTFENKELTINLHDALRKVESGKIVYDHTTWNAGELHTFTLWPKAVGVAIADKMNEAKTEKTEVVVKNKGNTWQYVRVNIVGNWVGQIVKDAAGHTSDPTILMGYNSSDVTTHVEVDPWNDKDGYTSYGTFVNLVKKSNTTNPIVQNKWVRLDKYYYYINAIGPNEAITDPIFDSYTVGQTPTYWIADLWGIRRQAQNVHLEMYLMAEAIEAPTDAEGNLIYPDSPDGKGGYLTVWAQALGLNNISDLDDLK